MLFAEDQDMIQAVPPERPDQALDIWILPGRLGCDRALANPHARRRDRKVLSVGAIIVAHQIGRLRVPRECLPTPAQLGRLRYFSAGADLNAIALRLNQRPRKTLGFQTPADRLQAVLH
jgi:hypothetical protein